MSWLSNYFLNPSFVLPGAALVSIPIIIHFLNRMRFKKVRFAAMEFLLKSDKRNRRRVMIEQLLLLAMRCAMVLLLVLL
ncbi:MAG: BatA domain-containing protein, partial [Planctomycetaceae bacterium]